MKRIMTYRSANHTGFGGRIGPRYWLSFWPLRWRLGITRGEFWSRFCIGPIEFTYGTRSR